MQAYTVEKSDYDASRPYAVVCNLRSFNKIVARYADKSKANRRARDMNARNALAELRCDEASEARGFALMGG